MKINHEQPDTHHVERRLDKDRHARPIDYSALTDNELLSMFVEDKVAAAMEQFVMRHERKVTAVCRSVTSCSHTSDDAFQATFLAAVKNARRLKSVNSHGGWLCRVAYNATLKALKRRQRERTNMAVEHYANSIPDPVPETWQLIEHRESIDALFNELFQLPKHYQDCLILYYFDGLSRKKIAARLGKSISSVKAMLQRGKSLLRSKMVSRGLAPTAAFMAMGLAGNKMAAASQMSAAVANCNNYVSGSLTAIPNALLELSEVGSTVWQLKTIVNTATVVIGVAAGLFLVVAANVTSDFSARSTHAIEVAMSSEEVERPLETAKFKATDSDHSTRERAALTQQLQEEISREWARLQLVGEWIHHKSSFLEKSNSADEKRFLSEIIDELNSESQGLVQSIAAKSERLNGLEQRFDKN